jgi:hypothetical protein
MPLAGLAIQGFPWYLAGRVAVVEGSRELHCTLLVGCQGKPRIPWLTGDLVSRRTNAQAAFTKSMSTRWWRIR